MHCTEMKILIAFVAFDTGIKNMLKDQLCWVCGSDFTIFNNVKPKTQIF